MQVLTLTDLDLTDSAEPRITDAKLAEILGYENPLNIRKLIERHRASLGQYGEVLSTWTETGPKGGRPGQAYSLNRRQALFICGKSETPTATIILIAIVDVFDAVTARQHLPAPANYPRITYRDAWRIRSAKLRLAEAVGALDMMGVDVAAINIGVVRDFWRRMGA